MQTVGGWLDTHGFVQVIHLYLLTAVLSDITATEVYLPMEDSSIIMIMRNIFLYHRSELFKSFLRVFYFTFLSFLVLEISIHCVVHYDINCVPVGYSRKENSKLVIFLHLRKW